MLMIEWTDIFQFVTMLIAVATLFYTIGKRK